MSAPVTAESQRKRAPESPSVEGKGAMALLPGLVLVAVGVVIAAALQSVIGSVPMIVVAVLAGAALGNTDIASEQRRPGLSFAATTLLRSGIVLLGLRLSVGDITGLGWSVLLVIVATVLLTFMLVQVIGHKLGLSPALCLLVASGFSICGNSAIASVSSVAAAEDDEVAAAVGLVTLCGTAAIVVVPALGSALGLSDPQLGVWVGAGVQDTAQVIAVGSAAGPAVLAIATAVKLTRVLFLAPIVGIAAMRNRTEACESHRRPAVLPLFVMGFLGAVALRSTGQMSTTLLDSARSIEQYLLAAGMVGLGVNVRLANLRRLGARPLLLGLAAWVVVGGVSLGAVHALGV